MAASSKPTPLITPADGGRWMSQSSADTVGVLNYREKVNFRRDGDVEARREGWHKFRPNASLPQGVQHLNVGEKVWLLAENVRPNSDRCVIAATKTKIYRYRYSTADWLEIGSGFSVLGKRWQVVTIDGYIVLNNAVNLPVSYRVEDSAVVPVKELREKGIASIGWICEYNGFLMGLNIVEIQAASLATVMNGSDPYGLVASNLTNHIPYRVIWSEFGQPVNWAPLFNVTMGASSATIALPFASSVFVAGVTRVAVLNGGIDGTTLGGDSANPEGILVTAVAGNVITLAAPTNSALTYPREVQVTRWTDISAQSAYKDLQGDASHITSARVLHKMLVIYRTRGIYAARYTADEAVFDWSERVPGCENVPIWPESMVTVGDDEYHLYAGKGDYFYSYDGVNPPELHAVMNETRKRFFVGITRESDVWAVNNPVTKETWFCRPGFTVCFDYTKNTASEMDAEVTAAALVSRPGWDTDWFVLAIAGSVYTYGRIDGAPTTFLRDGVNPGGRLVWGRGSFGDTFNEKRLRTYQVQLSSHQEEVPLRVKLFGAYSASADRDEFINEVVPDLREDGGVLPAHFQSIYFEDELHVAGDEDKDVRVIGRLFERSVVRGRGTTRNA
jgi:hypothetical protein